MWEHNLVVKWSATGDYEGFTGVGFTEENARRRALAKATAKASEFDLKFTLLTAAEFQQLSKELKKQLKCDWNISRRMILT